MKTTYLQDQDICSANTELASLFHALCHIHFMVSELPEFNNGQIYKYYNHIVKTP